MALNDEARAEAAAFVRAGRISMAAFVRTRLHLSSHHPRVGDQLVIEWEVRCAGDPADAGIQLFAAGALIREGLSDGRIAIRVPEQGFEVVMMVGGRVRQREEVMPQLRVPELFGLAIPEFPYHDDVSELCWVSSSEIRTFEVRVDPGTDNARSWDIDPGATRVAVGPLMPGEHHVELRIASADSALSARASRVIDVHLQVRERPPWGTLAFDRSALQLGQSSDLHWQIDGARDVVLIDPAGEARPVAAVGHRALLPEHCGDFGWTLVATAALGAETRLEARLQVLAPPVALYFESVPGGADFPLRLTFEASGAVSLRLELPQRGQCLSLPLSGHIEADSVLNEVLSFLLEAADGRTERRTFVITQAFALLHSLETKLLPLPATLLTI